MKASEIPITIHDLTQSDVRPEVMSLARVIDRLPSGEYSINLTKPDIKGQPWTAEIVKREKVSILRLWR